MTDHDRLLDLMVSAFKPGDAELRRIFAHDLLADPGCPPANRVVLYEDGQPAAVLLVFVRSLRLGAATIPTACIGAVAVDPARKGSGLGRKLMDAAHQRIRAMGLPWVFLIGIDHFYHRLGYRPCLAEDLCGVPCTHLPPGPDGGQVATESDLATLDALAAASYAIGAWGRVRGPGELALQLRRGGFTLHAIRVLHRAGRPVAWHLRQGGFLWECAAADNEAAAWVWRNAAAQARLVDPATASVSAALPAGHPCRRVLAGGAWTSTCTLKSYGGAMGLILDERAFVRALAPGLIARAQAIGRSGVVLRIGGAEHRLSGGGISVEVPDSGTLLTAVSGIAPVANLPVAGDQVLLDALFPVRGNGFSRLEYF